jgi:hypothetical protein
MSVPTVKLTTRVDYEIMRGDDLDLAIYVTVAGVKQNIAGETWYLTIRKKLPPSTIISDADDDVVAQDKLVIAASPSCTQSALSISHDDLDSLDGEYQYDTARITVAGKKRTPQWGFILCRANCTRSRVPASE